MPPSSLFLASLLSVVAAAPAFHGFVLQRTLTNAPLGFTNAGPADDSSLLNLRIALSSSDVSGLEKALLDISSPSSPNYGKHLSKAEVNAFVAPTDEATTAVQTWLASHGLAPESTSPAGDWLSVSLNVSKANEMLNAKYDTFQHVDSGNTYPRTLSFSLPVEVADFVSDIHPTTIFNNPVSAKVDPVAAFPRRARSEDVPASCATTITPACIQALYGVPTTPATEPTNSIAVAGFNKNYANVADLATFLESFRPDMPSNTTFTPQSVDGGLNPPDGAAPEANLDTQYTVGIATGVPVFYVSVGPHTQDGLLFGFLDIVNFLLGEDAVPQVLSVSYGEYEILSKDISFKLCDAYMALGARGTSVIFASGDGGVAGNGPSDTCTTFQPQFPSGCPYLTSVGSVHGIAPSIAASDFSGGGFSNYWATPDYQTDAVAAYLAAQGSTYAGLFNASGRGYPDVAAHGENVQVVRRDLTISLNGTSASAPVFASIVALLNDQLIAAGKPALGFLNPWLYANPGMLDDVVGGSNPGCNTTGFEARSGWDPATGLGTPNFARMKAAAGL
ncbi:subtilisin-like protein [Mycena filopes]|nr:subtilisin-like protein [Mycena filopes]